MLFTDAIFLFYFLPFVLFVHRFLVKGSKGTSYPISARLFLFLVTLVFYGWRQPWWVVPFVFSISIDFFFARALLYFRDQRLRTLVLVLSIVQNLLLLSLFKYRDSIRAFAPWVPELIWRGQSLPFPAGLSFYTFEALSLIIDLYRRKVRDSLSVSSYFAFFGMFPRFIAGPIARYSETQKQLTVYKGMQIRLGLELFAFGLFTKVILADPLARFVDLGFSGEGPPEFFSAWIGIVAFGLQLFFDFSGYSWMALGLGRCLGFTFPSNFASPYTSRSLSEFWRCWHQSLSFWFRDYVYIPLGGNRGSQWRVLGIVFLTMILAGIWHGPGINFLLFGAWNGFFLCLEKILQERTRSGTRFSQLRVVLVFWLSLVFFRSNSFEQARSILSSLFSFQNLDFPLNFLLENPLALALGLFALLYCFALEPRLRRIYEVADQEIPGRIWFSAFVFLLSLVFIFSSPNIPFLYFQF